MQPFLLHVGDNSFVFVALNMKLTFLQSIFKYWMTGIQNICLYKDRLNIIELDEFILIVRSILFLQHIGSYNQTKEFWKSITFSTHVFQRNCPYWTEWKLPPLFFSFQFYRTLVKIFLRIMQWSWKFYFAIFGRSCK